jgi:hypothetical protein
MRIMFCNLKQSNVCAGARALAIALPDCKKLETLYLQMNQIGDEGHPHSNIPYPIHSTPIQDSNACSYFKSRINSSICSDTLLKSL